MSLTLRRSLDARDVRMAVVNGRTFELHTCRNVRGNITGYGLFERWDEAKAVPGSKLLQLGEWHIDPSMATERECRAWLEQYAATGELPPKVAMFAD